MNILIESPGINNINFVSGISSFTRLIINNNPNQKYFHFHIGNDNRSKLRLINYINTLKQIYCLPKFIKKNQIELVHQNLPVDYKGVIREYLVNVICKYLNVPVLLHIHGGKLFFESNTNFAISFLLKKLLYGSKIVIVQSEREKEFLIQNFRYNKINVLPNAIENQVVEFHLKEFNIEKIKILYLGRIEKEKGIYELLDALVLLKAKYDFQFILCGNGSCTSNFVEVCKNKLGCLFEYLGVVNGDTKYRILSASDYFILPSYFEGLPISLLEAMSFGLVPIITKVGAVPEVINDGVNGILIESYSSIDIYKKILFLIENTEKTKLISFNAYNTIQEKHSISRYVNELNLIYQII